MMIPVIQHQTDRKSFFVPEWSGQAHFPHGVMVFRLSGILDKKFWSASIMIGLIWIFVSAFNVTKAVHIDDTVHLEIARHILDNPLHPMSGSVNWFYKAEPIHHLSHPPLLYYLFALVMACCGPSLPALHLLIALFSLGALWFFYCLANEYSKRIALWATALFGCGPVFIPSQNLMADIPLICLWLGFFWFLLVGIKRGRAPKSWAALSLAALLCSLACLIKYTSFILIPIFIMALLLFRAWKKLVLLLVPALFLGGWALFSLYDYGGIHFLDQSGLTISAASIRDRMVEFWIGLGAVLPVSLILTFTLKKQWERLCGAGLFVVALVGFYLFEGDSHASGINAILRLLFFSHGLLLWCMVAFYVLCQLKHTYYHNKEPDFLAVLMALWFFGVSFFIFLFMPLMAIRYILMVVPPILLIVLGIMLRDLSPPRLLLLLMLVGGLGSLLAISDWHDADLYRQQARQISRLIVPEQGAAIWFVGHWGWQWYAAEAGFRQYDLVTSHPQTGDIIIIPHTVDKQLISTDDAARLKGLTQFSVLPTPLTWLRTVCRDPVINYYAFRKESQPWGITTAPLETFSFFRFD